MPEVKKVVPIMVESSPFHAYSNNTEIGFTPWDIRFKFREMVDVQEERPVLKAHGTIVMTPTHAKVLLGALQKTISMYEDRFGVIDLTKVIETLQPETIASE